MRTWFSICILLFLFCSVVSAQEPPVLIPRVYLPIVIGSGAEPHRVNAALSQCCTVTCDKVFSYGAEWVSGWNPYIERCGLPSSPMIRDLNQWEGVKAGVYSLSETVLPIQMLNEPENGDCSAGACINLTTLVTITHEIELAYPDKELASPAFLPSWVAQAYTLLDWVDAYYNMYGVYPRFEILTLHAYGSESLGAWSNSFNATANDYDSTLNQLEQRGYTNLRVWITEMGFWCADPQSMLCQMDAKFFLQAWFNKCNADSRCEYINWFSIRNGDYGFVMPLEFANGTKSLVGQLWVTQFAD